MNSTTEILKINKGEAYKRDVGAIQTGNFRPITIRYLGHISSSRCPNDLKFLHRLGETQAYNFHVNIKI